MALNRRGSRRIAVDGSTYRWRVRRKPTYSQGLCWSPWVYAVEGAACPGAVLVVTTNQPRADNWTGRQGDPVLPADVAQAVRTALLRGWTPELPGLPFHLEESAGFAPGFSTPAT